MRWLYLIPFTLFAALAVVLFRGLSGDPTQTPFAMQGQPVPAFELTALQEGMPGLNHHDFKTGDVRLLNVWATWCPPCVAEHPLLMELSAAYPGLIHSINYKDNPAKARAFLATRGDPFDRTGVDDSGRVSIEFGLAGVPETYLIDGDGTIIRRWQGALNGAILRNDLLPALQALERSQ